jgi:hypothetical protein
MNNKKEVCMKKILSVVGMLVIILSSVVVNQLVAGELPNDETVVEDLVGGPCMGMGPGFGPNRPLKPGIGPQRMKELRIGFALDTIEDKVLEVIKKNDPSLYNRVSDLKKNDSVKYEHLIKIAFNMFAMTKDLGSNLDKDITRAISLEWDVRELSQKYDKAQDVDKTKIKNEIKTKLNEIFDIKTKVMELRVKKLEERLKDLKDNISKRRENKETIVNQRLNQLTKEKYLNW